MAHQNVAWVLTGRGLMDCLQNYDNCLLNVDLLFGEIKTSCWLTFQILSVYFCFLTGIKKYIVGLIIKTSSDASSLEKEKTYLGKLNMILVQVSDFII
jgi:hypothetical protein